MIVRIGLARRNETSWAKVGYRGQRQEIRVGRRHVEYIRVADDEPESLNLLATYHTWQLLVTHINPVLLPEYPHAFDVIKGSKFVLFGLFGSIGSLLWLVF